ncbi:MAG: hypothetical protein JNG89_13745 [Planctomycetaceae bacterium]|nr:hypothetical protein [Planctomycetaceae bacterium]
MLTEHPNGNYHFLPGIAPYSCGVVASSGFEIVHVTLSRPVPVRAGFSLADRFLSEQERPRASLCAMALRSPAPFTFAGFAEFNRSYAAILQEWGVFAEGVNPVARTNVAPVVRPPETPSLHSFSFTRPCATATSPTFIVAGGGELPDGFLQRDKIVALGDTSPAGLETKARFVMDLMEARLIGLGAKWSHVSTANVYTAHPVLPLLPEIILGRMGAVTLNSVNWCYSRPPIEEIEFEMDLRGVRTELRIDP